MIIILIKGAGYEGVMKRNKAMNMRVTKTDREYVQALAARFDTNITGVIRLAINLADELLLEPE